MRNAAETKGTMPKLEMRSLDIPLYEGQQGGRRVKQSTRVLLVVIAVVVMGFGYFASTAKASEPRCTMPAEQKSAAGSGADGQPVPCSSQQVR